MFKFYSIQDLKTIKKIIGLNPTIKFSSAFDLNDPFELKFNLKIDPYEKGQEEEYFRNNPSKTIKDFNNWKSQITDNFVWYEEQNQRKNLSKMITLSCFTEENRNNLMWSHYANNHQGICVEYSNNLLEYLQSFDNFLMNDKVRYSTSPPVVNNLESDESKFVKMLFNKQSEWKYEKEHRIVLQSKKETDFIQIDSKFIKSVYIGSKCSPLFYDEIIQISKMNQIKVYQAITLGKTYNIQFEEYQEGTFIMKSFWG